MTEKHEKLEKYIPFLDNIIRKEKEENLTAYLSENFAVKRNCLKKLKTFRNLIVNKRLRVKMETVDKLEKIMADLIAITERNEAVLDNIERDAMCSQSSKDNDNNLNIVDNESRSVPTETVPETPRFNEIEAKGAILNERRLEGNSVISDICSASRSTRETVSQISPSVDNTRLAYPEPISNCNKTKLTQFGSKKERHNRIQCKVNRIFAKRKMTDILTNSSQNKNNMRKSNTTPLDIKSDTSKQDIISGNKAELRNLVHFPIPKFNESLIQQPEIDASDFQSYEDTNKGTEGKSPSKNNTNERIDHKDDVEYVRTECCDKELTKCDSNETTIETKTIIDGSIAGESSLPENNEPAKYRESGNTSSEANQVKIPILHETAVSIKKPNLNTISEVDILQALKNDILSELLSIPKLTSAFHEPKLAKVVNIQTIHPKITKSKLMPNSTMDSAIFTDPSTTSNCGTDQPTTLDSHCGITNTPKQMPNTPNLSRTTPNNSYEGPSNPTITGHPYNSFDSSLTLPTNFNERPVVPTTSDSMSNSSGQLPAIPRYSLERSVSPYSGNVLSNRFESPNNSYEGPVGPTTSVSLRGTFGHSPITLHNPDKRPVISTAYDLSNTYSNSRTTPDYSRDKLIGPSLSNTFDYSTNTPNYYRRSSVPMREKYRPHKNDIGMSSQDQSFSATSENYHRDLLIHVRNSQHVNYIDRTQGRPLRYASNRNRYTERKTGSRSHDNVRRRGHYGEYYPRTLSYITPNSHNNQNENLRSRNHLDQEHTYQPINVRVHKSPLKSDDVQRTDQRDNMGNKKETFIYNNTQHDYRKSNLRYSYDNERFQNERNNIRLEERHSKPRGIVYSNENIKKKTAVIPISKMKNYKIPKMKQYDEKKDNDLSKRRVMKKQGVIQNKSEIKSPVKKTAGEYKDEIHKNENKPEKEAGKKHDDTPLPHNMNKVERSHCSNQKIKNKRQLNFDSQIEETKESNKIMITKSLKVKVPNTYKSNVFSRLGHIDDTVKSLEEKVPIAGKSNVFNRLGNIDDNVKASDSNCQEYIKTVNDVTTTTNTEIARSTLKETNKKPATGSKESENTKPFKYRPGPKSKTKHAQNLDDNITSDKHGEEREGNNFAPESEAATFSKSNVSSEILCDLKQKQLNLKTDNVKPQINRTKISPNPTEILQEDNSLIPKKPSAIPDPDPFTDKDYYFYKKISIYDCRLCKYSGADIVDHYKKEHPHSEIPLSRMRPKTASKALEQLQDINIQAISTIPTDTYTCRFCCKEFTGSQKSAFQSFFWHVVKTHTGEYNRVCSESDNVTNFPLNLDVPLFPKDKGQLIGYMCDKCNFTQISRLNLETHITSRHNNEKIKIHSIILNVISRKVRSMFKKMLQKQNETKEFQQSPPDVNTFTNQSMPDTNGPQVRNVTADDNTDEPPSKRRRKTIVSDISGNLNKSPCKTNIAYEDDDVLSNCSQATHVLSFDTETEFSTKRTDDYMERVSKTKPLPELKNDHSHFKISPSISGLKEYVCCINGKENHFRTKLLISMKKHVQTKHNELWNGYCFVCKVVVTPQGQQCDFNGCLQHLIDKHMDNFPVLLESSRVEEEADKLNEEPAPKLLSTGHSRSEITSNYDPVVSDHVVPNSFLPKTGTISLDAPILEHVTNNLMSDQTFIKPKETDFNYEEIQSEVISSKHQVVMNSMSKEKLVNVFKCAGRYCSFTSDSAEEALVHASAHARVGGAGALRCAYCSFDCAGSASNLVTHVFYHHGPCTFACGYCFYRAAAGQLVAAHIATKHPGLPPKVLSSYVVIPNTANNQNVLPRDVAVPYYICPHACQYRTYAAQEFCEHIRQCHANESRHACKICSESENSAEDLVAHMKCHGLNVYQCTWCVHGADSEPQLLAHEAAAHPARQPQAYLRRIKEQDGAVLTEPSLVTFNEMQVYVEKLTPNSSTDDPVKEVEKAMDLENLIQGHNADDNASTNY